MTNFSAFYFIDAGTAATHLLAFDKSSNAWRVPCGLIPKPKRSDVTYAPEKRMCGTCVRLTEPRITRRTVRRSSNR